MQKIAEFSRELPNFLLKSHQRYSFRRGEEESTGSVAKDFIEVDEAVSLPAVRSRRKCGDGVNKQNSNNNKNNCEATDDAFAERSDRKFDVDANNGDDFPSLGSALGGRKEEKEENEGDEVHAEGTDRPEEGHASTSSSSGISSLEDVDPTPLHFRPNFLDIMNERARNAP